MKLPSGSLRWSRVSIGTKLATITALVLTFASLALFFGLMRRERASLVDAKQNAAVMVGELFAASLGAPLDFGDEAAIAEALSHLERNTAVIGAAIWPKSSEEAVAQWEREPNVASRLTPPIDNTQLTFEDRIEVYRNVHTESDQRVGSVAVVFSLSAENQALEARRRSFLMLSLILAAVVAGVLVAIVRFQIVSRVAKLAQAVRDLQYSGVMRPVVVESHDEVGELGEAFNLMGQAVVERAQRLQNELDVAAQIQTSILPKRLDAKGLEIAARMKPASEAGGDYYEVLPTNNGCWLGIGDVSGHGLNAGLVMMMIQSMISALVQNDPEASPSTIISLVNEALVDNIRNRLGNTDYATLALLRYQSDGSIVCAGEHEDLLVYRAARKELEFIGVRGAWVGAMSNIEDVTQDYSFQLEDGDVLLLYTDGAPEARDAKGNFFTMERLQREFLSVIDRPPSEICDHLIDAVVSFRAHAEDDLSFLVARYKAPA